MLNRIKLPVLAVFCAAVFIAGSSAPAQEIETLKGLKTVKAVFDVRYTSTKTAARHLKLVHQTVRDLVAMGKTPDFKMVFVGQSVKMVSSDRGGFTEEETKDLDAIVEAVAELSNEGVGLEICKVALGAANVDPNTVLPELKRVENGWFSLIGYQSQGYALLSAY